MAKKTIARRQKRVVEYKHRSAPICPFYDREREGHIYCEGCRITPLDRRMRRDMVYSYCGHPEGFKRCSIYGVLMLYYERQDAEERERG